VAALIAGVVAGMAVGARWASRSTTIDGHPYVSLYDPPRSRAEAILVQGDGQAFAALAQDPLLARRAVFSPTAPRETAGEEAAYRAGRPLFGWLGWAVSLGRPGAVPVALLALTVLGAAAFVASTALAAASLGRRPDMAVLAVLLPGSVALLGSTGPEALGTGLAIAGAVLWCRERRWAGVVAMTAAALTRETLVIVPLAIVLDELRRRAWRPALLVPPAALAIWDLVDRSRYGYFPWAAGRGRLAVPWTSLGAAARWSAADAAVAIGGAVLVGAGTRRLPVMWRGIVAGYVGLALVMGPDVWKDWWAFSRPLLPLYAIAFIGCLPYAHRTMAGERPQNARAAVDGHPVWPWRRPLVGRAPTPLPTVSHTPPG
jgi:hypothetical protein